MRCVRERSVFSEMLAAAVELTTAFLRIMIRSKLNTKRVYRCKTLRDSEDRIKERMLRFLEFPLPGSRSEKFGKRQIGPFGGLEELSPGTYVIEPMARERHPLCAARDTLCTSLLPAG